MENRTSQKFIMYDFHCSARNFFLYYFIREGRNKMAKNLTKKDFYDLYVNNQRVRKMIEGFSLSEKQEYVEEVFDEICTHIADWYDRDSYYPKPEDIIQDYTFCSPQQAHDILPLFESYFNGEL